MENEGWFSAGRERGRRERERPLLEEVKQMNYDKQGSGQDCFVQGMEFSQRSKKWEGKAQMWPKAQLSNWYGV
jgi:hypothetical protein